MIRSAAEIIQRDSHVHYRVQQLIIDSLEANSIPLLIDQLDKVWATADKHLQIERKTIEAAEKSIAALEKTRNVAQLYLLKYLIPGSSLISTRAPASSSAVTSIRHRAT